MSLIKFTHLNKHNNLRSRIVYHKGDKPFTIGKGFGEFVDIKEFKYDYTDSMIPPHLFTGSDGKTFIVPTWQEVLPETTINDITFFGVTLNLWSNTHMRPK